ncbi:MAG: hypothetical protein WCC86_03500 [Methanoregula sp.]
MGLSEIPVLSGILPVPIYRRLGNHRSCHYRLTDEHVYQTRCLRRSRDREKVEGKIDDLFEGVGFFGRPDTFPVPILGKVTKFVWISIIIIAICTNLSAIQRILYLYSILSRRLCRILLRH